MSISQKTLHKARLTALHAICVQIFRHIAQKSLAIRKYACGISMQSAEKSDYASYAQALFSVSFIREKVQKSIFRKFAKKRQMTREVICRFAVWLCVLLVLWLFCCLYMVEDTGEQLFRHQL